MRYAVNQPVPEWVECYLCRRRHADWWFTTPPPSCRGLQDEYAMAKDYERRMRAPLPPETLARLREELSREEPLVPRRQVKKLSTEN